MSNRPEGAGAAGRGWRRHLCRVASAVAALLMTWAGVPGDARAERIVLKSGEVIEGSIIDATRNTVVIRRAIGGMRQMRIRDIDEVRIDLAQGREVAGQFLSWADGVYQVGLGDEIVRVSESGIVSREPRQIAVEPPADPAAPPADDQTVRMAAAPPARGAEADTPPEPAGPDRNAAAGEPARLPPGEAETAADPAARAAEAPAGAPAADGASRTAGKAEAQGTGDADGAAADDSVAMAAVEDETAGEADAQAPVSTERAALPEAVAPAPLAADAAADRDAPTPASSGSEPPGAAAGEAVAVAPDQAAGQPGDEPDRVAVAVAPDQAAGEPDAQDPAREASVGAEGQAVADAASQATAEQELLAIKASADPLGPDAKSMVFKIELSRPAEQTVVLIYGTIDGTAKAGEDYEPQQGVVTLTPGEKSAEVLVPLLDGGSGDEKRFELFLMADSKVAEVVDKRVIATIKGTD